MTYFMSYFENKVLHLKTYNSFSNFIFHSNVSIVNNYMHDIHIVNSVQILNHIYIHVKIMFLRNIINHFMIYSLLF